MREELNSDWRQCFGVFFTESDSGPVAIFKREQDAIAYAENHDVPDCEKGYHLKHGNICVLKCDVTGTFWNSFEPEPTQ